MSPWSLRPTDLGRELKSSRARALFASLGALAIVAYDLSQVQNYPTLPLRYLYAFTGLLWLYTFSDAKIGVNLGLRLSPKPSWRYWAKASLVIAGIAVACLLLGEGVLRAFGAKRSLLWTFRSSVEYWEWWIKRSCLEVPPLEELLYRVILCVPLTALAGPWAAIVVSTACFGALHFAYGIAGPENVLGGALLAWAFLKSESILVPLLLHVSGNFAVGLAHRALSNF
ncbi:MAG: CPBP family intramembrane glutamic endopeptidase [Bdellovibrionota bacterium]